jgi:DNA-binding MarR family transcriptional regulator
MSTQDLPNAPESPSTLGERFRAVYWKALRDVDSLRLQQWEQSQLTLPQLRVLFQVRRSPGVTTGQLARSMGITVSTTSGLVTKLVDAGLVARGISEDDRRQIPLELTGAGQSLAGELAQVTRPFLEKLAQELGPDLGRVVAALEAMTEAAARARDL